MRTYFVSREITEQFKCAFHRAIEADDISLYTNMGWVRITDPLPLWVDVSDDEIIDIVDYIHSCFDKEEEIERCRWGL